MSAVVPLRDGAFDLDPRLFPDARANPGVAARLLGLAELPAVLAVPVWAFLWHGPEGPGLIDSGGGTLMGAGFGGLPAALADAGVAAGAVRRVWLTHLHGDHCGGLLAADGAAAFPSARIALAASEWDHWTAPGLPTALAPIAADARRALAPYAGRIDLTQPGETVDGCEAIAAPGHTPGHTAWALPGALAAGDMLHVTAIQTVRPDWSLDWDHDPAAAATTRRALTARAAAEGRALLCAHAGLLAPDVVGACG